MSHENTVLDLASGLNVLVGPNNSGKSALIAALQIVCDNPRGTDYVIRHGCAQATITIETDEGHTISWSRKRSGGVHYTINGREVHRGRTPDDLHELLRLPQVDASDAGARFDVHFGEQKSPIFLLDMATPQK
jgi:chromosome segregation ATPase